MRGEGRGGGGRSNAKLLTWHFLPVSFLLHRTIVDFAKSMVSGAKRREEERKVLAKEILL